MSLGCRVLPLLPPGESLLDGPRLSWMPNKVSSTSEDLFLSQKREQEVNIWCPAASFTSHSLPFSFLLSLVFFSFSHKKKKEPHTLVTFALRAGTKASQHGRRKGTSADDDLLTWD